MLCRDCKHLKTKKVGYVSHKEHCGVIPKLGVLGHLNTVHPKCPLRINKKILKTKGE